MNDPKTNEALGYIGFNYADLPALKSGQGLHIGWHSLRKCAGQSEVSGKIWFGVCYLDSKGAPIGVDFARKAEMNSISGFFFFYFKNLFLIPFPPFFSLLLCFSFERFDKQKQCTECFEENVR